MELEGKEVVGVASGGILIWIRMAFSVFRVPSNQQRSCKLFAEKTNPIFPKKAKLPTSWTALCKMEFQRVLDKVCRVVLTSVERLARR